MKRLFLLSLTFLLSGALWAQTEAPREQESSRDRYERPARPEPKPITDRLWVGGNVGAGFGNIFTFVDVSPRVGYMVTDRFSVGPGFTYQYLRDNFFNYSTHIYGPNVFARYQLFDFLFLHTEYEHLFLRYQDDLTFNGPIRVNAPGFYAGGGLSNGFGDGRSQGYIMILYNFNETRFTPGSRRNPIIQFGFQIGL